MSADLTWLGTAFLMGLLGGTHCVGMCGGLSSALTYALPDASRRGIRLVGWQLLYNSGRLLTYSLLGLMAGWLLSGLQDIGAAQQGIRIIAGVFMILLGAYLAGWFQALGALERIGAPLWRKMEPLRRKLLPVTHPAQAVAAGMLWGFLPCGLVYSAMALAVTRAVPVESALVMLAFGLGTLPTLMATGTAAGQLRRLLQRPGTRQTAGLLVILFGLWTIIGMQIGHHHHGASHDQPMQHDGMSHDMDNMEGHDMSGMDMSGMDHEHMQH